MGEEEHDDARCKDPAHGVLGFGGDFQADDEQCRECGDQKDRSEETVLLAEDRVDEVGVDDRAREVPEFVECVRRLESLAPEPRAPDGVEGLVDRPSRPLGIQRGIQKDEDAVFLVGLEAEIDDEGNEGHADQHEGEEVTRLDAGDIEHGEHHGKPDQGAPEVWLDEDQEAGNGRDHQTEKDPDGGVEIGVVAQKQREGQHPGKDRELRWLEVSEAEVEPTAGSVDLHADEEDKNEQDHAQGIERDGPHPDPLVVVECRDEKDGDADEHPADLAGPERRVAHPGGAVDGVDSEDSESEHQIEERLVEGAELAREHEGVHGTVLSRRGTAESSSRV